MNARIPRGDDLVDSIVAALRRETFLTAPSTDLPLPSDVDLEQEVVAAMLAGYATPADLAPLRGKHFYSRILGVLFVAVEVVINAGLAVSDDSVLAAMEEEGIRGDLVRELEMLKWCTPACVVPDLLRQHRDRILELWRQRRAIAQLDRIVWSIRCGELAADAALKRIQAASW